MPSTTPKVHQAIASALAANGIDTIFGLIGDGNMFMVDSFVHDQGGTFVAAGHEAGGAFMALGYAALSGHVGICSVTHGPALANTMTALLQGVKASLPMVLLCSDVGDPSHTQNIAQREIIVATGAGFEQLRSPETVAVDVANALRRAMIERRPVALNLPQDYDWADAAGFEPITVRLPDTSALIDEGVDFQNAVGIIAAAKRPVILAGRGASTSAARSAMLRVAERIGAPVATTLKAKDLFHGERHDLGICGTVSAPDTVDILLESDCLIAFGASLNAKTLSSGGFRKGKRIVQVNVAAHDIGQHYPVDAGVVGDPATVADRMLYWLDEAEIPGSGFRDGLSQADRWADDPEGGLDKPRAPGTVDYDCMFATLGPMLPENFVLVTDAGRFVLKAWTKLRVNGADAFLSTVDFGSIGLGMAHAIGAAYAKSERPIVLVTGDGGFMHGGLAEFNTAVRHKLDLIVIVCNNGAYGAEVEKFKRRHHDRQMQDGLISFDWPDLAQVATALGGAGVTIASEQDWSKARDAIDRRDRPLLIDVKLDVDQSSRL